MNKTTANDFIQTNQEYEKLKKGSTSDTTPRDRPARQGPGRQGYDKALFEDWTVAELRSHALLLEADVEDGMGREQLIALLESSDATRARSS